MAEAEAEKLLDVERQEETSGFVCRSPLRLALAALALGVVGVVGLVGLATRESVVAVDVAELELKMHDSWKNDPDCTKKDTHHLKIKTYCGPVNKKGQPDSPGKVGKAWFNDGAKYVGSWKDGMPNGHGSFWFRDGGKFVGVWKDGQANGEGLQTYGPGPKGSKEFPYATVQSSKFDKGMPKGVGVAWSTDHKKAWMMKDGELSKKLKNYDEAKEKAKKLGLPV